MLTLSVSKGEGFWLVRDGQPDERWELIEVFLAKGFVVRGPAGREYEINQDDEVEIAPKVWLSDGLRRIVGRARINITAPQSVTILRDERYQKKRAA